MMKAKKYDWKDSNMALFGSDTERKVKKESAQGEPAWEGAGQEVGLQIWRIVKFQVTHWEKSEYGSFYNGDSYIILNTYKDTDGEELKYDVHFWIGKYSTQDEYGTAAYKTVELDTFLDDRPIQHREVQGHESKMFRSYFSCMTLLEGGADTGFNHVTPDTYLLRLFHVKKQAGSRNKITCKEIEPLRGNLTSDDVYIIDNGLKIYQFNGASCSHDEKFKAATKVSELKGQRSAESEVIEESEQPDHAALNLLQEGTSEADESEVVVEQTPVMFCVSDADGSLDLDPVDGYGRDKLNSDDVFVINTGKHVYCWIGKGASIDERKNGLPYACNYLNKTDNPYLPITCITEDSENDEFRRAFV